MKIKVGSSGTLFEVTRDLQRKTFPGNPVYVGTGELHRRPDKTRKKYQTFSNAASLFFLSHDQRHFRSFSTFFYFLDIYIDLFFHRNVRAFARLVSAQC